VKGGSYAVALEAPRRRFATLWPAPSSAGALRSGLLTAGVFVALASAFFFAIRRPPLQLFGAMLEGSFGSGFALSETLVKASPIALCALAAALPARLGLISVGAEGQLFVGAIFGTGFVLSFGESFGAFTLPAMLGSAALGGALYAGLAGLLRVHLRANETISTLLLNYISPLLVDYLVYGPWKDPASLGWPATVSFPDGARLPTYFETRLHLGLPLAIGLVLAAHALCQRTRFGVALDLLRESPPLAARAGLRTGRATVWVLALGGAAAGLAGIAEASVIEGRLQSGLGAGAGYSGFLVAFLGRSNLAAVLPLSLLVAALVAAGDNLQLQFGLPSSVIFVLQGLLFVAALMAQSSRASSTERVS
jgi:general nucleoside transport system permease protein